jgi:hypothetical protein
MKYVSQNFHIYVSWIVTEICLRNYLRGKKNVGQMSKIWAWHQDILTDWLTVSRNVTLTLTYTDAHITAYNVTLKLN